jgi:predicted phosphodiesterase
MKVSICSDLHCEFGPINLYNDDGADVLILSGDILVADHLKEELDIPTSPYSSVSMNQLSAKQRAAKEYRQFFKDVSERFPHVIYIAGNHEFYDGEWHGTITQLREECIKYKNVYFMERDNKLIGDFLFIGCTLWTDCNKEDWHTMRSLSDYMNDYRKIKDDQNGYRRISPQNTVDRHKQSLEYIEQTLHFQKPDQKVVIVGHHAPSKQSTHPRYQDDYLINGGYSSDLSEFILNNPRIKLWTHGHTHEPFDYMIGETRIVANPRGYIGYEECANRFELKTIEI